MQDTNQKLDLMNFDFNGKPAPVEVQNVMQISASAEMSVKLLEDMGRGDSDLLYFLGCLPGGITLPQLEKMWKNWNPKNLNSGIKRLKKLSLLERGDSDRKVLTWTMINFVQTNLELESMKNYMKNICKFYINLLLDCYQRIGKIAANLSFGRYESLDPFESILSRKKQSEAICEP